MTNTTKQALEEAKEALEDISENLSLYLIGWTVPQEHADSFQLSLDKVAQALTKVNAALGGQNETK